MYAHIIYIYIYAHNHSCLDCLASLSGRQSLAGHEHRGDDEAAREHL